MMNFLHPIIAVAAFGPGAPQAVDADIAWIASGKFCEPETVLPLPDDTLLVSNVCDFRKRGNGFLTLLDADGTVLDWRIVDGLDAPLGMALLDGLLHVVDNNRVVIFRWPGYEAVESIDLETAVANDIAVASDGTIFVTDTGQHQVVKRAPDGVQTVLTGEPRFTNANGIALRHDQLYVGGERLWRVDLRGGSVETVGPAWLSDIDGIEFEWDGALQVTPVAGPLVRFRGKNVAEILGGDGVSSANHGYSSSLHLALIPTGFDNTVIAIRITVDPTAR